MLMFRCECCDREWSKKYTYERHMKSLKSLKRAEMPQKSIEMPQKSIEMPQITQLATPFESLPSIDNLHLNILTSQMVPIVDDIILPYKKKIQTQYFCDYCHFSTTVKKEAEKHRKSKQHVKNEIKEEDFLEITNKYVCLSCEKSYDKYVSCWKHSKSCKGKPVMSETQNMIFEMVPDDVVQPIVPENTECNPTVSFVDESESSGRSEKLAVTNVDTILEKIADNNTQMMGYIENVIEKMTNIVEKVITSNNNTLTQTNSNNTIIQNNNTTNNHCTINMFLNEKCKDAVNITDWVNGLVIDFEHLYYNAENGFQKGLTKMMIDNLKLYNVYKRPIHFTDVKRDTMYIKDADEWTKHENNEKLIEVLESSARQGINCFADWMGENAPAYHDLDSQLGQQYMAIHQNVIRPERERKKAYPKVMKEVAREVKLRKEDQT